MAFAKKENETAVISPAKIIRTTLRIKGTAPYVQHRFWKKVDIMTAMATPKASQKTKAQRSVRDYDAECSDSQHRDAAGGNGIPCAAFRTAMIDACRTIGLVMTKAKMSVFVIPDSFDVNDGTPLVALRTKPERYDAAVRNDNGAVDIRVRPMWREWSADVTVEFDEDMITAESVVNLLDRAGRQVGIGEGRPFSKDSTGCGFGTFRVVVTE